MKRIMSLILAFLLMFMLSACSSGNQEISDTQEQEDVSNGSSQIEASNESEESDTEEKTEEDSNWSLSIPYLPIASMKDTFIVQDESTSYYGLIDSEGNEILSCDYKDMEYLIVNKSNPKYYVKVQEKGSYGVYDLSGQLVVSPDYDIIFGTEYIDAFYAVSNDNKLYVDLDGNEIDYDSMTNSPLSGEGFHTLSLIAPYYFYADENSNQFCVMDLETGENLLTVPLPDNGNWYPSTFGLGKDVTTGNVYGLFIFSSDTKYYINIDEDGAHYIDINELNIYTGLDNRTSYYPGLAFYNGTSFAFTTDDRLIVIDADGNIVRELDNNFSDKDECQIYADCAILNNNGYIYVIDKEGNIICDEAGYTSFGFQRGAVVLTTAEGYKEVVDTYGNFVMTRDSNTLEWNYEWYCEDVFYWDGNGVCHIHDGYTYEEYAAFSDEFSLNLENEQGGAFTNEEQTKKYVFAPVNGKYEIRLVSTDFRVRI